MREPPREGEDPAHGRRLAAGRRGSLVDHAVGLGQRRRSSRQEQADRHGPAIRPPPDETKHAWHPGPDPDPDVVGRGRSARRAPGAVVLPVEDDTARLVRGPDFTDDRDRLLERLDGLAGGAARPAHRLDRVPNPPGTDPQLETTAGEQVDRGGGAGQHDRRPQREVQHVVAEPNPRGARRHVREEGPGVEEARLVRVVLERHQVEAGPVRDHRQLDGVMRSLRSRRDERPEEQLVSVIHVNPLGLLVRVRGDVLRYRGQDGCRRCQATASHGAAAAVEADAIKTTGLLRESRACTR